MAMSNENGGTIQGEWLRLAIQAQNESPSSAAAAIGKRRDFFTRHFSNEAFLKAESLADLSRKFPTMNMRYVLTGQGSPLLPRSDDPA